MNQIKILASGMYLPKNKVTNEDLANKFKVSEQDIYERTGIKIRYDAKDEKIEDLAKKAVEDLVKNIDIDMQKIGLIITTSTTSMHTMPGISYKIQKQLQIKNCVCFDLLAGCNRIY